MCRLPSSRSVALVHGAASTTTSLVSSQVEIGRSENLAHPLWSATFGPSPDAGDAHAECRCTAGDGLSNRPEAHETHPASRHEPRHEVSPYLVLRPPTRVLTTDRERDLPRQGEEHGHDVLGNGNRLDSPRVGHGYAPCRKVSERKRADRHSGGVQPSQPVRAVNHLRGHLPRKGDVCP